MARVHVAPISFGLGDLVVSLPAVQGLIGAGRETWLVARSGSQAELARRIEGLAGVVREEEFLRDRPAGEYVNLRDHPLQRAGWWGSPEFELDHGPLRINDILERICADQGVPADFSRPRPLRAELRPGLENTVVLVADSDGPAKRWPRQRWLELAASLRRRGRAVGVLTGGGDASDRLAGAGIDPVPAPSVDDAVDVLTSSAAVVGVDSGLTHVAVQQVTPTIVLHRRPPVFARPWGHCRVVLGVPCLPECLERSRASAHHDQVDMVGYSHRPWDCAGEGRCMESIAVADVHAALDDLDVP